ncbi:unnamed protein product [Rhodiola kirilowii]
MPKFVSSINLYDDDANSTIGQLLRQLQISVDKSEFENVEKLLRKREEMLKEEAWKEMETEVEKVKRAAEIREDEISREFLTEMEQMSKGLNEVEAKYEELVKWKVGLEESFDEVEKEKGDLVEEVRMLRGMNKDLKKREEVEKVRVSELIKSKITVKENFVKLTKKNRNLVDDNSKLRREVRALREMNEEFKKREEDQKVRFSELARFKVTLDESLKKIVKENKDLVEQNLRLKKEVRVWREMNEELKKQEVAEKVKVLELESKIEAEEGLRMRAEEDLRALKNGLKEMVESRVSMLDNVNNMPIADVGLDSHGTGRVARTTSLMESVAYSRRCDVGSLTCNVIDLSAAAGGYHPGATQTGNLMEVVGGSPTSCKSIISLSMEPMMKSTYDDMETEIDQVTPKIQYNSKGQRLRSHVWEHMTKIITEDNNIVVQCNHCKNRYKVTPNSGTSHLGRHLAKCLARQEDSPSVIRSR